MLTALVVGLAIGLLQALTQIQEQTLVFVPKIVAVFIVLLIALPFAGGAVKLTVACAFPRTAVTAVGAPGTVAVGVTTLEANDGAPVFQSRSSP